MSDNRQPRQFTGVHAAAVFAGGFAVIIAVNLVLAVSAVRSFPGLEVRNSYVASQEFDTRRAAQEALGWTVQAHAQAESVVLTISDRQGRAVEAARITAVIGRATHMRDDIAPEFRFDGQAYVARADLAAGYWNIRLAAQAQDGTAFRQRLVLHVRE